MWDIIGKKPDINAETIYLFLSSNLFSNDDKK